MAAFTYWPQVTDAVARRAMSVTNTKKVKKSNDGGLSILWVAALTSEEVLKMPREHEDYRNNIEQLNRLYPDKEMLTIQEATKVMGFKSIETTKKYVPFTNRRVSKAALARVMCGK